MIYVSLRYYKMKKYLSLTVVGCAEAADYIDQSPGKYRVISISSPENIIKIDNNKVVDVLYLAFDDVIGYGIFSDVVLVSKEQCESALDFLKKGGHCLVHCTAGVSRSASIALGYLIYIHKDYQRAVDILLDEIRHQANPNKLVLKYMCEILGKTKKEIQDIQCYIEQRKRMKQLK